METAAQYQTEDDRHEVRDARTENRFFVDNIIVQGYGPKIGVYGIAVYSALCMHSKPSTQKCWPSHRTIAEEIGCSPPKVKEALRQLEILKLIRVEPHYDSQSGRQTSNTYTLLDPPPITDTPDTTDTRPQYRDKSTMNNPNNEQSQEYMPPTADTHQPDESRRNKTLASDDPTNYEWTASDLQEFTMVDWDDKQATCGECGATIIFSTLIKNQAICLSCGCPVRVKKPDGTWINCGQKYRPERQHKAGVDREWSTAVKAWCKISGKAYPLPIGTYRKLAELFKGVGSATQRTAEQVTDAITRFPSQHEYWKSYDWPNDGFLNRLGMMLAGDAKPEPLVVTGYRDVEGPLVL